MTNPETEFEVIKDASGKTLGFSLIAGAQTEGEDFVGSFPKALRNKKADIKFEGNEIVFVNPDAIFPGRCAHKLDQTDLVSLQDLLASENKLKIEKAGFFTPGFKIVKMEQ